MEAVNFKSLDTFQGVASPEAVKSYLAVMDTIKVYYKEIELTPACTRKFIKEALKVARAVSFEVAHIVLVKTSKTPWIYTSIC